jgi:hypothetical protein
MMNVIVDTIIVSAGVTIIATIASHLIHKYGKTDLGKIFRKNKGDK